MVLCLVPIPRRAAYGAFPLRLPRPESGAQRALREGRPRDRRPGGTPSLGLPSRSPKALGDPGRRTTGFVERRRPTRASGGAPRSRWLRLLVAESSPRAIVNLDQYLDRLSSWSRRKTVPSLKELGPHRRDGGPRHASRKAAGTGTTARGEAARHGRWPGRMAGLLSPSVRGVPRTSRSVRRLEGLVPPFEPRAILAARLQQACRGVTTFECRSSPPPRRKRLMGQSAAKVLEPDQAFPALHRSARPGPLPTLSKVEDPGAEQMITTATVRDLRGARSTRLSGLRRPRPRFAGHDAAGRPANVFHWMKGAVPSCRPAAACGSRPCTRRRSRPPYLDRPESLSRWSAVHTNIDFFVWIGLPSWCRQHPAPRNRLPKGTRAMLEIKNLHARVGDKDILRASNLTVGPGSARDHGPERLGKSTLAHVLAGRPLHGTEGTVL